MSGEKDVVRPLNFFQIYAQCQFNPPAVNIYLKELFGRNGNISEQQALAIFQDKRNYGYKDKAVISLGKLCNVIVDETGFKNALMQVKVN